LDFKLSENQLNELLVAHFAKYRFFISQITDFHFAKYRFSLGKLQIFILQITDFAKYRFSFRFVPFRFVSQITVSPHNKPV